MGIETNEGYIPPEEDAVQNPEQGIERKNSRIIIKDGAIENQPRIVINEKEKPGIIIKETEKKPRIIIKEGGKENQPRIVIKEKEKKPRITIKDEGKENEPRIVIKSKNEPK